LIESVFKYQGRWLRQLSHSGSAVRFRHVWLVDRQWLSAAESAPMRIPSKDHDYTLAAPFFGTLSASHGEKGPIVRMAEVKHISKTSTEIVFSRGAMESP
jgi:hypothetical protein